MIESGRTPREFIELPYLIRHLVVTKCTGRLSHSDGQWSHDVTGSPYCSLFMHLRNAKIQTSL